MALFVQDMIALDPGSATTSVYVDGKGVCLREPTAMLVSKEDSHQVAAIGEEAARLIGKHPEGIVSMPPVLDGAVTDTDLAALLLLALSEKASGRKKPSEKGRLLVSAAPGLTPVEHAALTQAVRLTGAKRIAVVNSAIAGAIGADIDITKPNGVLWVDLGAGCAEVSVLSSCAVAATRTMRTGSMQFDETIVRYMRSAHGVSVSMRAAEEIKKCVGSAIEPPAGSGDTTRVYGRDLTTGKPVEISVNAREIAGALRVCVDMIIGAIRDVLIRLPAEFSADIRADGIHLSGGCSLLNGLTDAITAATGLPVHRTQEPQDDVVNGLARIGRDESLLHDLIAAGSAIE